MKNLPSRNLKQTSPIIEDGDNFALQKRILRYCGAIASVVSFLADAITLIKTVYNVEFLGRTEDLLPSLAFAIIMFLFGIGVGILTLRKNEGDGYFSLIVEFYLWIYLAITVFTYLSVAVILQSHTYSQLTYLTYILLLAVEIGAIKILYKLIEYKNSMLFAVPVIAVNIVHLLLMVYTYMFTGKVMNFLYLVQDLFLFVFMATTATVFMGLQKKYLAKLPTWLKIIYG